ncbi:MAG: hypothetical protein B6D59_02165 [Campylobacteraceae bacterium 4484_4]|nr:MAG: hypothetical protein B6D59_02165 [Campylobacteraceae bacterium 4484_4]
MKLCNTRYRSEEKLETFLAAHALFDNKRLLIQIFCYHQAKPSTLQRVVNLLRGKLPQATIVGISSAGEIMEGRVLEKNIVLSFAQFESTDIRAELIELDGGNYPDMGSVKRKLLKRETKVVLGYFGNRSCNIEAILQDLIQKREDIVVAGALCSSGKRAESGFVLLNDRISHTGIVLLSLSGSDLQASSLYSFDYTPIGRAFKVTKSQENILYTVDKIPLKELYRKYLGEEIASHLPKSGMQFPFVIAYDHDYLPRTPLVDRGDGSFGYGSDIPEGTTLSIAFADIDKIVENGKRLIEKVCTLPVEGVFIFDSVARKNFLQNLAYEDVAPFRQIAPHAGLFCDGECYGKEGEVHFLSQTLTLLTLSEDPDARIEKPEYRSRINAENLDLQTIKALSNIARVSSQELQELNMKLEKRIKEEVEKNRKKEGILIHNSRLAQMGEMMSMIAHQWRQPLSAISATSTGLQVKIELDNYDQAFFLDALQKIEEYVLHLSHTIDDFANFFKPNKKKEDVEVKDLIEKALFIIHPSLKKHSILVMKEIHCSHKVHTIYNEVVQVLLNLIKNAENALLKKGVLEPKIMIRAYEKGEHTVIEVEDNAGGIPAENLNRIFEPYFSTKQSEKSTGLGLYMSKFIIEESCGGKLEVENSSEGAKFTITL